jgi:uncharacterized phage protein gp47/JayE
VTRPFLTWTGGHLEGTDWQGIRLVTIDYPPESASPESTYRAIVTTWLNQPAAGLTKDNIQITSGRRLANLAYDVDFAGNQVRLLFPELGDHSLYRVCLVEAGNNALRLHPFYSIGEFRFRIGCETGDCRPPALAAAVAPAQPPEVDLLTKDFNGFVQVLGNWVKVRNPHWADLSTASFERVLVDLFAWQGDMLSYYQDRVANEAFIDTASQRFSLRQHALLLGTGLDEGNAARSVLAFDVTASGFIPAGLEVKMDVSADETPVVFSVSERIAVYVGNNTGELVVAAWPDAGDAEILAGATEMLLFDQTNGLDRASRLAFVQGAFAQVVTLLTVEPIAQAGWVADPDQSFDPLLDPPAPLTRVRWLEPLQQPVHPWRQDPPLRLHANLVDATHGENKLAWVAPFAHGAVRTDVVIRLDRRNSIVAHRRRGDQDSYYLAALQVPEAPVLFEATADDSSKPALMVLVDGEQWSLVPHLHASKSFDRHYTVDADTDGLLWIGFGDGMRGREIRVVRDLDRNVDEPATRIELRYRIGDPISGNVGVDTLTKIVRPRTGTDEEASLSALGFVTVTNVLPGRGGRQPQSLDKAREDIPASLKHGALQRAVSLQDYQNAAMQVPGVARARARALGGVFNSVLILIDPLDAEGLSPSLQDAIYRHIDAFRMAGREHFVQAAEYISLKVAMVLCAAPGFVPHLVRDRVLAELRPGSKAHPGWFHPDRLSFGDALYLSDLIAFVQGIPGVDAVKVTGFRPLGDKAGSPVRPVIRFGVTQVPRLDDVLDFPENGKLTVQILGLDAEPGAFKIDKPAAMGETP